MSDSPIFIHSLFRSGSTYLFQIFRRSAAGYWCYQEPLHEFAFFCRENPSGLQNEGEEKVQLLRHPKLDQSYFKELAEAWPIWKDAINEHIIYDAYFEVRGENIGIAYWQALAKAAQGRPVFQECRTSGRIDAIKTQMGGKHIYLWRNPWDQWWSYKVAPYFDVANQLIVHARHAPASVHCMLTELQLPCYEGSDLVGASAFYNDQLLTSEQSYLIFYLLWCLALREGSENADLMLNIDRLSDSADYQFATLAQLKDAGIDGIDFSDCRVPQGRYLDRDQEFFAALERRVHQWLAKDGWGHTDIEKIQALRQQYQPRSWSASIAQLIPAEIAEQASRARDLAIRFETNLAERTRAAASQLSELESRVHKAEVNAQRSEAGFQQEQARAQQIEQREGEARAQLQQALEISREAQQLAQQAEARATEAEARAIKAESATHQALKQANESHERVVAICNSKSWQITAPIRILVQIMPLKSPVSKIPMVMAAKLKQIVRALVVATIRSAGNRAQSSPGFKRFALRILSGHPKIQQKILRIYLENQSKDTPQSEDWVGLPTNAIKQSPLNILGDKEYMAILPPSRGINENQRSPLEKNYNIYRGPL